MEVEAWKEAREKKLDSILDDTEFGCVSKLPLSEKWFISLVPFEWSRLVEEFWSKPFVKKL